MALDVYVGSLTQYYGSVGKGLAAFAKNPEQLHPAVLAWRKALNQRLGDNIPAPLEWDETPAAPQFTGCPGWDGWAALVLWAAYAEHPVVGRPNTLPDEWENDPALARCNAAGFRSRYSQLVRHAELWLPSSFLFTFDGEDVGGHRVIIGSAPTLRRQLADLNVATWKADDRTVSGWGRRRPPDNAPLELRARYGFAAMAEAAQRAVDHGLPIKIDY